MLCQKQQHTPIFYTKLLIFIFHCILSFDSKQMPKMKNFKNKRLQTGVTAIQRLHKSHKTVTQLFVTAKNGYKMFVTAKKQLQIVCNGINTVTKQKLSILVHLKWRCLS